MVTEAAMWKVCAQAASMLDVAASDWRKLLEVEDTLWPLAAELEDTAASWDAGSPPQRAMRWVDPELRLMHSSLSWVRRHEYDALETELERHLDIALRSAMNTLDHRERSQQSEAVGIAGQSVDRSVDSIRYS